MIERDVVGGAAHLWDCIPSKTMIATGGAMAFLRRSTGMGLEQADAEVDTEALTARIEGIKEHLQRGRRPSCSTSQGVRMVRGAARFVGPYEVEVDRRRGHAADRRSTPPSIATGSRPRIPEWCTPDGDRILTTRDCYPPKVFPERVTRHRLGRHRRRVRPHVLVVRRQGHARRVAASRCCRARTPRSRPCSRTTSCSAASSCSRAPGRRRSTATRTTDGVVVRCDDGRVVRSTHAVLAIGSVPNSDDLGLDAAGVETDAGGYVPIDHNCVTNVRAHLRRRRRQRQAAAVVGGGDAGPQGGRAR